MKKNKIRELIDPSLAGEYDWMQIKLVLLAASLSIQESSIERPGMSQVHNQTLSGITSKEITFVLIFFCLKIRSLRSSKAT